MKKEHMDYLKEIGITSEPILNRIEEYYGIWLKFYKDEPTDIIIEDYIEEDGSRYYEHLTFFHGSNTMSADNFITEDDISFFNLNKNILGLEIVRKEYDFKKSTEKSRLNLTMVLEHSGSGSFKASKNNCDYLKEIIFKFIFPNLKD